MSQIHRKFLDDVIVLSVRSIANHTEWKITDLWLGAIKPIPSPTFLKRQLQIVLLALIPLSV